MEKLKFLKNKEKRSGKIKEIFTMILGFIIILSVPIIPIWGLRLMGMPIELSFSSWGGSCIVSLYLLLLIKFSKIETN